MDIFENDDGGSSVNEIRARENFLREKYPDSGYFLCETLNCRPYNIGWIYGNIPTKHNPLETLFSSKINVLVRNSKFAVILNQPGIFFP